MTELTSGSGIVLQADGLNDDEPPDGGGVEREVVNDPVAADADASRVVDANVAKDRQELVVVLPTHVPNQLGSWGLEG